MALKELKVSLGSSKIPELCSPVTFIPFLENSMLITRQIQTHILTLSGRSDTT